MGKKYSQLNSIERAKMEALLNEGFSFRQIAKRLERAASTICREYDRHKIVQIKSSHQVEAYCADSAHNMAKIAESKKGARLKIGKDYRTAEVLEELLSSGYSPYAALVIADKNNLLKTRICVKTLYSYIYKNVFLIDKSVLIYGARENKEKEDFENRRIAHNPITHPSIEDRPVKVLSRTELGHWEMDTVVGSTVRGGKGVFLTLIERKTRYLIVRWLKDRTQKSIISGLDSIEKYYGKDAFPCIFKSITMDNGVEFLDSKSIKRSALCDSDRLEAVWYCHPYCSSERGSNEVVHRFLRRKWAKGADLSDVDPEELNQYVSFVNNYPRKIFNGASAAELFYSELSKIRA